MAPLSQRIAFGVRLRALRTDRGWSQEEFAHRAELDRTYVSGVERGVRNPTLDVITKLADTLEIDIADLFPRNPRE
jgi:transcriptional regulator with XRE-family HTH domain